MPGQRRPRKPTPVQSVACPKCKAQPGALCQAASGWSTSVSHIARRKKFFEEFRRTMHKEI